MKRFLIYSASMIVSLFAFQSGKAQAIQKKLETARKHPRAKENAARADVYIVKENQKKNKGKGLTKPEPVAEKKIITSYLFKAPSKPAAFRFLKTDASEIPATRIERMISNNDTKGTEEFPLPDTQPS